MLSEQQINQLDWEKVDNLMPAIVQHAVSGEVLMMGYMNKDALAASVFHKQIINIGELKKYLSEQGVEIRVC